MNAAILAAFCASSTWCLTADSRAAEVTFAVVAVAAVCRLMRLARRAALDERDEHRARIGEH